MFKFQNCWTHSVILMELSFPNVELNLTDQWFVSSLNLIDHKWVLPRTSSFLPHI